MNRFPHPSHLDSYEYTNEKQLLTKKLVSEVHSNRDVEALALYDPDASQEQRAQFESSARVTG
jgi:hypothetical protein